MNRAFLDVFHVFILSCIGGPYYRYWWEELECNFTQKSWYYLSHISSIYVKTFWRWSIPILGKSNISKKCFVGNESLMLWSHQNRDEDQEYVKIEACVEMIVLANCQNVSKE